MTPFPSRKDSSSTSAQRWILLTRCPHGHGEDLDAGLCIGRQWSSCCRYRRTCMVLWGGERRGSSGSVVVKGQDRSRTLAI
nr:hypothetical protein CFP56_36430 [Quercus suber]